MSFLNKVSEALVKNAPAITTAVAVAGVAGVVVSASRDTLKAQEIVTQTKASEFHETGNAPSYNFIDLLRITWKCYIPTAVIAVGTVASIVALNRIGARQAASLASAVALSEAAMSNYRKEVQKKVGTEEERVINKSAKTDRFQEARGRGDILVVSGEEVLFKDEWSGRYFKNTVEGIRAAVNDTNKSVFDSTYASLSEFWDHIGLESTATSDELGWSTDELLEISFEPIMGEDNKPALLMSYDARPFGGYDRTF